MPNLDFGLPIFHVYVMMILSLLPSALAGPGIEDTETGQEGIISHRNLVVTKKPGEELCEDERQFLIQFATTASADI